MLKNNLFKINLILLIISTFFVISIPLNKNEELFKVFRIYAKSWEDVEAVGELRNIAQESQEIDFWLDSSVQPGQFSDVMVSPSGMILFEQFIQEHPSLKIEITVEDVQNLIIKNELHPKLEWRKRKKLKKGRENFRDCCDEYNEELNLHRKRRSDLTNKFEQLRGVQYPFGEYTNYNEMVRYMRTLEFYYPHLVQLLQIGTTHEGRSIEGVKIGINKPSTSDFQDENLNKRQKRAFWIDGNMHAREWASSHTALFIINQLIASYGKDNFLTQALEQVDFFIVPCANPDGFEFSRKNRSPEQCTRTWNGLLCCRGVDLNRNFDFHWAETGSSLNACSNLYSGKRAFSEPESRAISEFLNNYNEEGERTFYAFMTLHTYAQMWIHPFSHEYHTYPSDAEDLKNVALRATERLEQIYGTHYRIGTGADLLAPASGGSDDWAKETLGIKYVYLVELRPKLELSNGFILNKDELIPTAIETFEAIKEVIQAVMSDSNNSVELRNTTEMSILANETLKFDENEEERINSTSSSPSNEFKQSTESKVTLEMLESSPGKMTTLELTENQNETTTISVKYIEESNVSEQYTQHTTESFDFLIGIGEEELKEMKEVKIVEENKKINKQLNKNISSFSSSSQVLFPLFTIPKIQTIPFGSGFENEQKSEEPDLLTTGFPANPLPTDVNDQIENIETTEATSSSSLSENTEPAFSSSTETSISIVNDEASSTSSTISLEEAPISSTTIISNSTMATSIIMPSTSLSTSTESEISRSDSKTKSSINVRTSTKGASSATINRIAISSSTSSTSFTIPTPISKQYTPIKYVAFDEKKIELKPLNELKKYQNSKSSTNTVNFPIFDNDIELATENENESGEKEKMTNKTDEKIREREKLIENETKQNEELKQYKNSQTRTSTESVLEMTKASIFTKIATTPVSSTSETTNTTAKLPHLWMKTQRIFTLPWVQTRRLSLAKLLRIQKIPLSTLTPSTNSRSTSTSTTTPTTTSLPIISPTTSKQATMLFTATDVINEKNKQEFIISSPQLISPPIHPKLYLAPRFLGTAFTSSHEQDFCCLHRIGNDGQIKGITLKGASAINLLKSSLLEQTTKIPLITTETLTTTLNKEEGNNDEIIQIMPKKCSDKKSSCAFWIRAHSPVCSEQHHFMERNCAFSCGLCS